MVDAHLVLPAKIIQKCPALLIQSYSIIFLASA